MTAPSHFDQKGQSPNTQTNIDHAEKVIIQPSEPALPVPQQLPSPPKDFTGREEEIKSILDQFGQGTTITGLRGMGGVGKTALALVLADRLRDRFPDGQLFLEMQGTSKKPLTTEEAMSHVIRSYLGLDEKLPTDQNSLGGFYRSVLSGRKALILLDNAAERAQVEPLLPPPNCALLVTSRNKFALPGLKEKDLDVLPLVEANKLLLSICERIGEHAEELAKLCGCLPLALRNAAYALKEKPNISVANYTKRLEDARKRLELVEASFDLSYQLLTQEMQWLWSLLSVFPADFDLTATAAVWEMENDAAEEALGELVKWSLIDFMPSAAGEEGRYKLHDLARDFADSRLDDAGRGPARLLHARYYQKLLWAANELFMVGNDSLEMGLVLFDMNWMNIKAGQKWASENKFWSNEIAEICSKFAEAGSILSLRLHSIENIRWLDAALGSSRQTKDRNAEGNHLGNLGLASFRLGDPHKAIEYYNIALKIAREIGDRRGEVAELGNLGLACVHLGDPHKALEYYDLALKISREIGNRKYEGTLLGNLGNLYSELGGTCKAIEYYEQAFKITRDIGDRRGEGIHLCDLGQVYFDMGETHKAIEYYEQALKIAREIHDSRSEGKCKGNLGNAYTILNELRKAIEYYEQALKISHDIGDRWGDETHLGNLGNAYILLGNLHKAIEYYDQALKIAREIGDIRGEGIHLFNMSISLYNLGQRDKAIPLAESALAIFEEIESPHAETVRKTLALWKS